MPCVCFAVHAATMPGGDSLSLVGLAMGIYGLTQAIMQIPLGWASDKLGRRPVILGGLILFALGCWLGYSASSVQELVIARALQGMGAISAALSAYLADVTRNEVRSKGMAMIGASIGITFAVSLVAAPLLYQLFGLDGLFGLTGALSLFAMAAVIWQLPKPPVNNQVKTGFKGAGKVLFMPDLLRLNLGIFMLHLTQMALFVVVPTLLVNNLGLDLTSHWKVYLPVLVGSFLLMVPVMIWGEKQGKTREVKLSAIVLLAFVLFGFLFVAKSEWLPVVLLLLYFIGFNLLEATLPSWVSRVAPLSHRGLALGVYNTSQALGLFCGGALGGYVSSHWGYQTVFEIVLACVVVWFLIALGIKALPRRGEVKNPEQPGSTVNV
jgi:predicted MFS family arabinose efflux permease